MSLQTHGCLHMNHHEHGTVHTSGSDNDPMHHRGQHMDQDTSEVINVCI